jgi:hypothetical protein
MGAPYVSFHGLVLAGGPGTNYVDEAGVSEGGGERKVDDYSLPTMDYAEINEIGTGMVTFSFDLASRDRATLEEIIAEINTSPMDVEFYPRDTDRCVYAVYAHASRPKSTQEWYNGEFGNFYESTVEVFCRNNQLLGMEQEEKCSETVLPFTSASFTNNGYYDAPIDYLYLSGYYDALLGYTDDVRLLIGAEDITLCNTLMRGDSFKMDRYGQIEHSYKTDFPKIYSEMQNDLQGSTYCNYGVQGSIAYESFVMGNFGSLMMPFYGPLPVKEPPYLEIVLTAIVGGPKFCYAFNPDLSDIAYCDEVPKIGTNKIYIPNADGMGFVAFGISTDSNSSCTVSSVSGTVLRYLTIDEIPVVEPDDTFSIGISDGEFSNHRLSSLHIVYRDIF